MDREILKQIIADQREYKLPTDIFDRFQINLIRKFTQDPSIIIISGIRRSGKSTIMQLIKKEMPETDYFLNFDDDRLVQFQLDDFQLLYELFIELFGKQNTFYFDEIQNIPGWEMFVRRLHDQGNKIYITGSNASLLSRELGTRLTGRFIAIEVYPLSFRELVSHELPGTLKKSTLTTTDKGQILRLFANYLSKGGIPDYIKFNNIEYLRSLYESILYRDIITKYGLSNEKPIKELSFYLASNIGKEFSYSKLAHMLNIGSSNTVSSYCHYLESCYLYCFLTRYSHSLQKQLLYNKKCYMIDPALINLVGFRTSEDKGRILENIVLINLKSKNEDVFFHKNKKECDFLIRKGNKIYQPIQVTATLKNQETRERELEGLLEAMTDYKLTSGLVLTENEEETITLEKNDCKYRIDVLPIWKWLLEHHST